MLRPIYKKCQLALLQQLQRMPVTTSFLFNLSTTRKIWTKTKQQQQQQYIAFFVLTVAQSAGEQFDGKLPHKFTEGVKNAYK